MSNKNTEEHDWCWDHLVPYMAGALGVDECARIEAHVAECQLCTREFKDLSTLTSSMWDLFSDARPAEDLEERVIEALRASPHVKPVSKLARVGLGIAALFFAGIIGFLFMGIHDQPGEDLFAKLARGPAVYADARVSQRASPERTVTADEMAERRVGLSGVFAGESLAEDELRTFSVRRNTPNHMRLGAPSRIMTEGGLPETSEERAVEEKLARLEVSKNMDRGRTTRERFYSFKADSPVLAEKQNVQAARKGKSGGLYFDPNATTGTRLGGRRTFATFGGGMAQDKKVSKPSPVPAPPPAAERPAAPQADPAEDAQAEPAPIKRRIIRNGDMTFEVVAFDPAVDIIERIVAEEKGFVATVNSEKLPNGKVRGTVVVRVPPENLDGLVDKLRALGELKRRRIGSQDVTKQYTDLESRLRAARMMEKRLLKIIEEGKGEIKDLVAAEKELGEWRTRIETAEGEKRYYDSMIAMSTLTLTLQEKEIESPSEVHVTEQVTMGVEVEEVAEAHKNALAAIKEAKGRVTKSELKQHQAGQLQAIVNFEVAPTAAGALRDLLGQLGVVARLDVQQMQQSQGGRGRPLAPKVVEKDTRFYLSLYNVANVTPRETVHVSLACVDAEASYNAILARVADAGGRIIKSDLNRQKNDRTRGTIHFEVKTAEAKAVEQDVQNQGEVMSFQVQEADDRTAVTKSKRGFHCTLHALGSVQPRERTTVQLAVRSVPVAYRTLLEAVKKASGRVLQAQLNESDRRNVNAVLDFDVLRQHERAIAGALDAAGDTFSRNSTRAEDSQNVVDSKIRMTLTLLDKENIAPRETVRLAVTVADVDQAVSEVEGLSSRVIDAKHNRPADGASQSVLVIQVPFSAVDATTEKVRGLGEVRVYDASRNDQVPEGNLATARFEITLSSRALLPADAGPMATIRKGLAISRDAGLFGLMIVVIGLCLLLPIGLAAWGGRWLYRKANAKPGP